MFFKKNKKYISLLLLLTLLLTLIACKPPVEVPQSGEINTQYTDQLKLTSSYQGKNFLTDGIGLVTLSQTVDGDTAHFRTNNTTITVRFLSINTPESTGRIDPWGKAASKFTGDILKKANSIVLESEVLNQAPELDTTGNRYLAYVWYKLSEDTDFRLLNLEIIEQCYSQFTSSRGSTKYGNTLYDAFNKSYQIKRRIFGEQDPSFDYTYQITELTIAEIRNNFERYSNGTPLRISARVMRVNGSNIYLEDINETFNEQTKEYGKSGIYMFSGYGSGLSVLKVGMEIYFKCQIIDNENYGRQLTNPSEVKIIGNPDGALVEVKTIPSNVTNLKDYEGFVVKLENVVVIEKQQPNETGAYTIYCEMGNGSKVNLRIDAATYPKFPYEDVIVGASYDVIGGVSKFHETYQIMIGNKIGLQANDLFKK